MAAGYYIVFLVFGLDIFHSWRALLVWLVVIIDLILLRIFFKLILPELKTKEWMGGIWGGVILYCLVPIFSLDWFSSFAESILISSAYIFCAVIVFVLGYYFSNE